MSFQKAFILLIGFLVLWSSPSLSKSKNQNRKYNPLKNYLLNAEELTKLPPAQQYIYFNSMVRLAQVIELSQQRTWIESLTKEGVRLKRKQRKNANFILRLETLQTPESQRVAFVKNLVHPLNFENFGERTETQLNSFRRLITTKEYDWERFKSELDPLPNSEAALFLLAAPTATTGAAAAWGSLAAFGLRAAPALVRFGNTIVQSAKTAFNYKNIVGSGASTLSKGTNFARVTQKQIAQVTRKTGDLVVRPNRDVITAAQKLGSTSSRFPTKASRVSDAIIVRTSKKGGPPAGTGRSLALRNPNQGALVTTTKAASGKTGVGVFAATTVAGVAIDNATSLPSTDQTNNPETEIVLTNNKGNPLVGVRPEEYNAKGAYCIFGGHKSEYIHKHGRAFCPSPDAGTSKTCSGSKKPPFFQCPSYGLQISDNPKDVLKPLCIKKRSDKGLKDLTQRCVHKLTQVLKSATKISPEAYNDAMVSLSKGLDAFESQKGSAHNLSFIQYCQDENKVNSNKQSGECLAILSLIHTIEQEISPAPVRVATSGPSREGFNPPTRSQPASK